MFVILSHPAYDNKKFKVYKNIPQIHRTRAYPPQVLTREIKFAMLFNTKTENRWRGTEQEAIELVPDCLSIGGNPLIVLEDSIVDFNPAPLLAVKIPQDVLISVYQQIARLISFYPAYDGLSSKISACMTGGTDHLELTAAEENQLHRLLKIKTEPLINALPPDAPDWGQERDPIPGWVQERDSTPPKRIPLIDMSVYEDEPPTQEAIEAELAAEQAIIKQLGFDPENIKPNFDKHYPSTSIPDSLYLGVSKADRLQRGRDRDKRAQRKHKKQSDD